MASVASAQYPIGTFTFDNATQETFTPSATFGYNPTAASGPNFRFDNGGLTPTIHHSVGFDSTLDNTGNGGGSVKFSQNFAEPTAGAEGSAFDMDLTGGGAEQPVSQISLDLKVNPTSLGGGTDAYGGFGYFQVFTRNDSYSYDSVPDIIDNGTDLHANGFELGDPFFSGTDYNWEHLVINFSTPVSPRALVFQDYSDAGRAMNGAVIYNIDNVQLVGVPEPATLSLLGLSLPALLMRRRAKTC
jgi:hypothetical protein